MLKSVIISDLHVSCGALDDCDREIESLLVTFVDQLERGTELIINGDFLDFVQAPPWSGSDLESKTPDRVPLCFTEAQSRVKLAAIAADHRAIFAALTRFLTTSNNRLVIMPGNHDPDFYWAGVQDDLRRLLRAGSAISSEQVVFHLDPHYVPAANDRVWIEHGHQHDPVNCFTIAGQPAWSVAASPIREDEHGMRRLYECTGTRFLIKYLNQLDADYPFVDNVKPFSRFLRIFGASAFVPGYGPLKAAIAVWAMLRFLTGRTFTRPSDLLGVDPTMAPTPASQLKRALERSTSTRRDAFMRQLEESGFALNGRDLDILLGDEHHNEELLMFIAEHPEVIERVPQTTPQLLSTSGTPGTLTLKHGFSADETYELIKAARRVAADNQVDTVVMGHTHESITDPDRFMYFNTGSWTRYYDFAKPRSIHAWTLLRDGSYEDFPYRLFYVDVPSGAPARKILFRERASA